MGMTRCVAPLVAIAALACSMASSAAVIESLTVAKDGSDYVAEARFVIDAPHDTVFGAFTAFDRLSDLNPAVIESRAEMLANGSVRVTTRLKECLAFFCRSVAVVEDVNIDGLDVVQAIMVPELSDFARGHTTWRFADLGRRTRVHYKSRVTPRFWLPAMIGSRVVRNALQRQIRTASEHLESGAEASGKPIGT